MITKNEIERLVYRGKTMQDYEDLFPFVGVLSKETELFSEKNFVNRISFEIKFASIINIAESVQKKTGSIDSEIKKKVVNDFWRIFYGDLSFQLGFIISEIHYRSKSDIEKELRKLLEKINSD